MTGLPDAVAALLSDPASALIAVDFDGTLAPIVARPEEARAAQGAVEVLTELASRVGAVAIISGRAAEEIVELTALTPESSLRVLGHYGLQGWRAGSLISPQPVEGIDQARALLADLLADAAPGIRVEDKTHSLAVHTRGAVDPAGSLETLRPGLLRIAQDCGLEAVPGRYVVELRPPGSDKGAALRQLAAELGSRAVIYVGDDLGDLPAYAAVEQLRREGGVAGLTVASVDLADSDVPPEVAASADLVLDGPTAVVAWLAGLASMLSTG
jgi:trehalose 6-phosphate phosphatase